MDAVKIPICKSFNVLNSQKQVTYPYNAVTTFNDYTMQTITGT